MSRDKILASIDIGTNSFHLIVAKVNSKGIFKVLTSDKEVVRLGSGSGDMKYLTEESIEKGISVIKRFKLICDSFNAKIRAIGTSALREALNREKFTKPVLTQTGIDIEIVTGNEEARLIYLGVLQSVNVFEKKILLIDIGGGSTEFLVGKEGNVLFVNSIKIGAVRLTQKYFKNKKISPSDISDAHNYAHTLLYPVLRDLKNHEYECVIGSSGTILNIGSLIYYENNSTRTEQPNLNNFIYNADSLNSIAKKIFKAETVNDILKIKGIDSKRADIITAGIIILETIFSQLKIDKITLSVYNLREGILMDSIARGQSEFELGNLNNIRYNSIITLAEHCNYDKIHCETVMKLSFIIFDFLKNIYDLSNEDKEYLNAACLLHDVGHTISHNQHHRHSYYIVRNSALLGYTENEIEIIANISRYHRKSHPKDKHEAFRKLNEKDRLRVTKLAGILRIADGLDRGHNSVIKDLKMELINSILTIRLITNNQAEPILEIWGANFRKELFQDSFGLQVNFVF